MIRDLLSDPRWNLLIDLAAPYQDKRNDQGHAEIVTFWAAILLNTPEASGADKDITLTAALLHDIGWSQLSGESLKKLFNKDLDSREEFELRRCHEIEGARLSRELLEQGGYETDFINTVASLIDGHDTRKKFLSIEDGFLQDADALWMVTGTGYTADLERRELTPREWGEVVAEGFHKERTFFSATAREWAQKRLSRLSKGRSVAAPGEEDGPRVLICHYRVGWTDGVSLEIEKREEILKEMGFRVALLAGSGSQGADYLIEDLDFDTPQARKISRNAFGGLKDYTSEEELKKDIHALSDKIEIELSAILDEWDPDFILLHNIFSHGRHIAAAMAFGRCLNRLGRPSLTTHHDFYWERDDFKTPSGPWVKEFLNCWVPPVIPGMRHAVINSLAARSLLSRTGIDAMIFPDTLDFSLSPWVTDEYNRHLLDDFDLRENDIHILQATRIVRRKGIELIPPIIAKLNSPDYLDKLKGKTLYNGKVVTEDTRFVFLLAGYAEEEAESYRQELVAMMNHLGVDHRFLRPRIAARRRDTKGQRTYSLFDTYPQADLVSYPSLYEGWGNQFIEAVFARKPVIVYEYPVFKSDIKPKGYDVISLGDGAVRGQGCFSGPLSDIAEKDSGLHCLPDKKINEVCDEILHWLLAGVSNDRLDKNYQLALENNSFDYLRTLMRRSMEHYDDF